MTRAVPNLTEQLGRLRARRALAGFLAGKKLTPNQTKFVDMLVDHLAAARGVLDPGRLYESPFTDIAPRGPEYLFPPAQVDELVAVLTGAR